MYTFKLVSVMYADVVNKVYVVLFKNDFVLLTPDYLEKFLLNLDSKHV
jgi:hypothetical protein